MIHSIDTERELYVLKCGDGFTCFGFSNARDHAQQIADLLKRPDLEPLAFEYGTEFGYEKYQRAVQAWAASKLSSTTYFEPNTPPRVRKILEQARVNNRRLRLFLGDASTGDDWCCEEDTVGHIGRSCGSMKVPLLIVGDEPAGGAILTSNIVRILEPYDNGEELYRHPTYRAPSFRFEKPKAGAAEGYEVAVFRTDRARDELVANFRRLDQAGAWIAFMSGLVPRLPRFQ